MKNVSMIVMLLFFCLTSASVSLAEERGPSEIILRSTLDAADPAKPATFPHGAHQARLECTVCHHSKDAAGKRVAFIEGVKIEKCESCHNSKVTGMDEKVNTFQKAGHALCRDCHKKNKPKLAKCSVCHKKQD